MSAATSRRIDPSAKLHESAPTTLFPLPEEREVTTWSSVSISLDRIIEDTHNPRRDMGDHDGSFAALVQSIKERGMLLPPLVRPVSGAAECQYHIIAGHRRIAAARALGWKDVRCTPMEDCEGKPGDYNDTERLIDTLVENTQRKDLNCIEVAEAIVRLEKLGRAQEEIGRWVGRGQSWVSKCARLVTLPGGVLTLLREGGLTQSHGEELLPLLGESFLPGEIEKLAHQASEQGLTVSGLRNVVRDKIERTRPVQTTLGDYATSNTGGSPLFDDDRIARTLAATKGLDKDPKPTPKDTNNLTRKESDKQFAAAMAPDPDVVPLSERPGVPLLPVRQVDASRMLELEPRHLKLLADLSLTREYLQMRIGEVLGDIIERRALELGVLQPTPVVVTEDVFPVFDEPAKPAAKLLTPSEAGEAQRQKELADQQAAAERKSQKQKRHEEALAAKASTKTSFEAIYCYPQNGEWQGGGQCEGGEEGVPAVFWNLADARKFAAEESSRNPRFLIHVTVHTERTDRQYDRCEQRGDLWYFRGHTVPSGVSNSIPEDKDLAKVGCVLTDLLAEPGDNTPAPGWESAAEREGRTANLYDAPQGIAEGVDKFAEALV